MKPFNVIPFYATAAIFFLGTSIMLLFAAPQLTGHHFTPSILAIVHTTVLGWASMLIFGAVYQLLPVLCEGELQCPKVAFASYLSLLIGTPTLAYCFWTFQTGILMITSGSTIVLASCFYTYTICATALKTNKNTVYQYFIVCSAIWLVLTTTAGLLLAINLNYNFIPRNHIELLKLHAHAGIVGWFLMLICGVSAKLVPMFLLGKCKQDYLLYSALILQNIGLFLFLVHGYFKQIDNLALAYVGLIFLGTMLWSIYIYIAVKNRLRKKIEIIMRQGLVALLLKLCVVITLIITFYAHDTKWTSIYGTFIFLGWITGLILSQTFKTLPFIVWNNLYKDQHGNATVPLPKNLYNAKLVTLQSYLFFTALSALVAALWIGKPHLLYIATALWVLLATLYCYLVAQIIFHKPQISHGNNAQ